jgi:ribosomal protein L11 methyltransferase
MTAGRRWLELSVPRPPSDELTSLAVDALLALGGRAVEEREGRIFTHVAAPDDLPSFLESAQAEVGSTPGLAGIEVGARLREHEEWSETWKRGLDARRITDRILVRPSWVEATDDEVKATIVLDPGMAFGTAEHGTTRGCLRLLDTVVSPGAHVLDVGAGSGILAIAAVLLGAASCVAVEADALSCEALRENVERNRVDGRVRCVEGRVDASGIARLGPTDVVVANIETGVLRSLLPGFAPAVAPGGWLILSGILAEEWTGLRSDVEAAGFHFRALDEDGEWRSGLFVRATGSSTSSA